MLTTNFYSNDAVIIFQFWLLSFHCWPKLRWWRRCGLRESLKLGFVNPVLNVVVVVISVGNVSFFHWCCY